MKRYSVILILLLLVLTGCSKLTLENYARITTGIAYDDVVKILGKPDRCSEALFVKSCVWGDDKKNITVNFVGNKAIFTSSTNIR